MEGSDFEVVDSRYLRPDTIIVQAGGASASLREGQTFTRAGSFADNGSGATQWTATVDYGAGQGAQALTLGDDHSFSLAHRYVVAGTYVVKVTVTAQGGTGATAIARFALAVRDVAPRVAALRKTTVRRGVAFRRRIVFTDPGADKWRTVVAWGDGSARGSRSVGRNHAFLIRHVFRRDGVFTVAVRVYDRHGGSGVARFRVTVRG